MRRLALAIGMTFAVSATAHAAMFNLTGEQLLQSCQSSEGTEKGLCLSYIMGASMGAEVALQSMAPDKAKACQAPPNSSPKTLRDAVVKHLNAHPADQSQPAALSVVLAERELWPCH